MARAKLRYRGSITMLDGTVCIMMIASPEVAEQMTAGLEWEKSIIDVSITPSKEEPETAVQWILESTIKIAHRIGVPPASVRRSLLVEYGADRKRNGHREYLITTVGPYEDDAPACGRLIQKALDSLKDPYKIYALRKGFREYQGKELRKLLEGLNQMMEDAGIPEDELASDRLINFYIAKTAENAKAGDHDEVPRKYN